MAEDAPRPIGFDQHLSPQGDYPQSRGYDAQQSRDSKSPLPQRLHRHQIINPPSRQPTLHGGHAENENGNDEDEDDDDDDDDDDDEEYDEGDAISDDDGDDRNMEGADDGVNEKDEDGWARPSPSHHTSSTQGAAQVADNHAEGLHHTPSGSHGELSMSPSVGTPGKGAYENSRTRSGASRGGYNIACDGCRTLKVRCVPDPEGNACQRCKRSNRTCVLRPTKRRPRKKNETRISALELMVSELTASIQSSSTPGGAAAFQQTQGSSVPTPPWTYSSPEGLTATGVGKVEGGPEAQGRSGIGHQSSPLSGSASYINSASLPVQEEYGGSPSATGHKRKHHEASADMPPVQDRPMLLIDETIDAVAGGLIRLDQAMYFFERYTKDMAHHLPAVVFPHGTTAEEVRRQKPVLFLSVIAVGSSNDAETQPRLVLHLMRIIAEKVVVCGQKSLELVQALILTVIWYYPPDHFEELKFYQLVHMAGVMAMDLGLGKHSGPLNHGPHGVLRPSDTNRAAMLAYGKHGPPPVPRDGSAVDPVATGPAHQGQGRQNQPQHGQSEEQQHQQYQQHQQHQQHQHQQHQQQQYQQQQQQQQHRRPVRPIYVPPDPTSLEARRTWLACFYLASNASMALRRPNLIRWTPFMAECTVVLRSRPDAAPTDEYFCHLVWTHRLAEEVGTYFSADDWGAGRSRESASIADQRTQWALRGFQRELQVYKEAVRPSCVTSSLAIAFPIIDLYIHESALQMDGLAASGGSPSSPPRVPNQPLAGMPGGLIRLGPGSPLTSAHTHAVANALVAIESALKAFFAISVPDARCLPSFTFVRIAFTLVVLVKIYFSAHAPGSELGVVFGGGNGTDGDVDDLGVEGRLQAVLVRFGEVAGEGLCRSAGKFIMILHILRTWFLKHKKHKRVRPIPAYARNRDPYGGRKAAATATTDTPNAATAAADASAQPSGTGQGQVPTNAADSGGGTPRRTDKGMFMSPSLSPSVHSSVSAHATDTGRRLPASTMPRPQMVSRTATGDSPTGAANIPLRQPRMQSTTNRGGPHTFAPPMRPGPPLHAQSQPMFTNQPDSMGNMMANTDHSVNMESSPGHPFMHSSPAMVPTNPHPQMHPAAWAQIQPQPPSSVAVWPSASIPPNSNNNNNIGPPPMDMGMDVPMTDMGLDFDLRIPPLPPGVDLETMGDGGMGFATQMGGGFGFDLSGLAFGIGGPPVRRDMEGMWNPTHEYVDHNNMHDDQNRYLFS